MKWNENEKWKCPSFSTNQTMNGYPKKNPYESVPFLSRNLVTALLFWWVWVTLRNCMSEESTKTDLPQYIKGTYSFLQQRRLYRKSSFSIIAEYFLLEKIHTISGRTITLLVLREHFKPWKKNLESRTWKFTRNWKWKCLWLSSKLKGGNMKAALTSYVRTAAGFEPTTT